MKIFSLLPILAIATLLAACGGAGGAQSVPAAGAANTSQSHRMNTAAVKPSTVTVVYTCKLPISRRARHWPVAESGATPPKVTHGTKVSMTGWQAQVTIPASVVNELIGNGLTAVTMEATTFDINATDAKPGTVNAAYPPISYGPVTLEKGVPALFLIPQNPITIGTWTALKPGTMTFTAGNAKLTLTDSKTTVDATCKPGKSVLATTTVS
jgi:hypothetical protein